jgi:hypothetical protein
MSAKAKDVVQHAYAVRASRAIADAGIREAGRDRFGNPFIAAADVPRLPPSVKVSLQKGEHRRITIK